MSRILLWMALLLIFSLSPSAQAGEVKITSLQYPASPETLSIGEKVPIIVSIKYTDMAESTLSLHIAYADFPPRFQSGSEITVSGSGTYEFPPAEIMVPASYSIPSGWPEYINEWHLKAEIWKGDKLRAEKAFTLLVENPENKPDVKISSIEYVVPPDTIAVGEESLVKVHATYSHLAEGTKIEATLRDRSGILDTGLSRKLSGAGEVTFSMLAAPRTAGFWDLEVSLDTVSGSMPFGDKKSFRISVVE
ncbi:MAG: hypothetical protein LUQ59_09615 [Methanothrix sp.]|nr:hypothetical protein [Methanothrix sp.]